MNKRKVLLFVIFVLILPVSESKAISRDLIFRQMSYYKPDVSLGLVVPQGTLSRYFDTGFSLGMNAFHKDPVLNGVHPGLNVSVNFLPPSDTDNDSYIDISILPSARYYQPGNRTFKNPVFLNDPLKLFVQGGVGITQWNTEGSSKLKVLDPSVSDTDFSVALGTGLSSQRMEIMVQYTNIFSGSYNIKYFTFSAGLFFW